MTKPDLTAILEAYPELGRSAIVPLWGIVTAVPDAQTIPGRVCIPERPRHAVDVRLLTPELTVDEKMPLLRDVPVAIAGAGNGRGFATLPTPGTVVEVAFAFGAGHLPFVRSIMPHGRTLPGIDADSQRWQQTDADYQEVDGGGNWIRIGKNIDDISIGSITCTATVDITQTAVISIAQTAGLNITRTAGLDITDFAGASITRAATINIADVAMGAISRTAMLNISDVASGAIIRKATLDINDTTDALHSIQAQAILHKAALTSMIAAPKNWIGPETENALRVISEFMATCIAIFDILASHNHPDAGTINQGGMITKKIEEELDVQKLRLDDVTL